MGVEQVITCDCCGDRLNSTSVLDCVSLQYMQTNGPVQDRHYGLACGCGQAALDAVTALPHDNHQPVEQPVVQPANVDNPTPPPADHTDILNNPAGA